MNKVEIKNVDKTIREIFIYKEKFTQKAKKITRQAAKMTRNKMKSSAPVGKTGNLRKSIKAKYFWKEGPAATVMPRGSKATHRHLVAYGTGNRRTSSGKNTGKMTANRFMDGADKQASMYFDTAIKAEVMKNVII